MTAGCDAFAVRACSATRKWMTAHGRSYGRLQTHYRRSRCHEFKDL